MANGRAKTWFITGAGRGLGLHTARAALDVGDLVIATGRCASDVATALGDSDRLRCVTLDVTEPSLAVSAVRLATAEFGRIDVLVNNAGYGLLGAFEELPPASIEEQFKTNVYGAFNVTRAVLPLMRQHRAGHIISVSSMSGMTGCPMASVYCATKHALAGWSDSLSAELEPWGIFATAVYPGTFRTDFFKPRSIRHAPPTIEDYRTLNALWENGFDPHDFRGDPSAFGRLIVSLGCESNPPRHLPVGSDALDVFGERAASLNRIVELWARVAKSTDTDLMH